MASYQFLSEVPSYLHVFERFNFNVWLYQFDVIYHYDSFSLQSVLFILLFIGMCFTSILLDILNSFFSFLWTELWFHFWNWKHYYQKFPMVSYFQSSSPCECFFLAQWSRITVAIVYCRFCHFYLASIYGWVEPLFLIAYFIGSTLLIDHITIFIQYFLCEPHRRNGAVSHSPMFSTQRNSTVSQSPFLIVIFLWFLFTYECDHSFWMQILSEVICWAIISPFSFYTFYVNHIGTIAPGKTLQFFPPSAMAPYHSRNGWLFFFVIFLWLLFVDKRDHLFWSNISSEVLCWVIKRLIYLNIGSINHISAMVPYQTLQCFLPDQWQSISVAIMLDTYCHHLTWSFF